MTKIKHVEFESTRIKSMDYDSKNKELQVNFHKGGNYKYYGVDTETFSKLCDSESVGKAFNKLILNKYTFDKL